MSATSDKTSGATATSDGAILLLVFSVATVALALFNLVTSHVTRLYRFINGLRSRTDTGYINHWNINQQRFAE